MPPAVKHVVVPMVTVIAPTEDPPTVIVSPVSSISVTVIHAVTAPTSSCAPPAEPSVPAPSDRSPDSHGTG